jgi:hypothetical protein
MITQKEMQIKNNRTDKTLTYILKSVALAMFLSILIFIYFIIIGYWNLGHIPFYGDKEVLSHDGINRIMRMIMIYPMCFGIYFWMFFLTCGILGRFKRERKTILIGFILCLLNITAIFSSQFSWIVD